MISIASLKMLPEPVYIYEAEEDGNVQNIIPSALSRKLSTFTKQNATF